MVRRPGFTLIEIAVVILLIGIITSVGLPRFLRSPVSRAQTFIFQLNRLVMDAAEQSQSTSEPRRVFFNLVARTVTIQTITGHPVGGTINIPKELEIPDVIINGVSQFHVGAGQKSTFYFLINADGESQQVQLMITENFVSGGSRTLEFYLHPFTSLFRVQ